MKNCSKINQNDYYKTTKFLRQNKLTLSDCLEIIHSLKVEDYYANTYSTNPDHLNNVLIIFAPQVVTLSDGRTFDNLIIYLKIDLDETTDEAIALLDKYLDDAFMAGLKEVTVIHGRGEGILRTGLQQMMKRHKHVKAFRKGAYNEGGDGVTIVQLK